MKKINITFSIPLETQQLLQMLVGKRKMSAFVAKVLNNALREKLENLKLAYSEAQNDQSRNEAINDWLNTDVEGWE